MSIFDYKALTIKGEEKLLKDFEGKVLLVVNTASNCGFTPQLKELQELYESYKDQGFIILGFPSNQFMNQEPGSNQDIQEFCQLNYGVTFPMFGKIHVNGLNAHPLFTYLTEQEKGFLGLKAIKWNFTKFLINQQGEVIKRYSPSTSPLAIQKDIEELLQA
ncbi:glutathione peroxidase [Bacillus suaedaesalsae]|uniref:Glutathione peroxidase n=1 Tax=Bacillus suaedaesalsae TaxID=2810349 RepID=A0ABS2DLH6_9BACI|nr:glutathione peroxidase [Bacillus suaedaesalsae]MBM6619334.1 glutathione peroxidase [Bacillus suaedaesalsae]